MRSKLSRLTIITALLCLLLLSACQVITSMTTTPMLTPSPTSKPTPTPIAAPTPPSTPLPTWTPEPTAVPTPSPTPKPLEGIKFGIDAGHQRKANYDMEPIAPDSTDRKQKVSGGTCGIVSGIYEYVFNLDLALRLRTYLEKLGAEVVMVRTTHDVNISNMERAQMMNKAGCDAWIRIHANGTDDHSVHGMFMLIPNEERAGEHYAQCHRLAICILDSVIEETDAESLGVRRRHDITGFNWSKIPVCLIEAGHMTNEDEDRLLSKSYYRDRIAKGMANGILTYFTEEPVE